MTVEQLQTFEVTCWDDENEIEWSLGIEAKDAFEATVEAVRSYYMPVGYGCLTVEVIERDMRGITRCSRRLGWHAYGAGPCFDTYEQALAYRESLDVEGVKWRSQSDPEGAP